MGHLRIKIRIVGQKNQEFVRFIVMPKSTRQRGKYLTKVGFWDTRQNTNTRVIVINIYKIMYYYALGGVPNKKIMHQIYTYFTDTKNLKNWSYFNQSQLLLIVENEIKSKYI